MGEHLLCCGRVGRYRSPLTNMRRSGMPNIALDGILLGVAITLGLAIGYSFSKKNPVAGTGIAVTVASLGIVLLIDIYSPLSPFIIASSFSSVSIAFIFSAYLLLGKNPRTFAFLSFMPLLLFVAIVAPSMSLAWVLAYAGISFAAVTSFDFSRMDLTAWTAKAFGISHFFVKPFSLIERGIRKIAKGSTLRFALISAYLAFQITFIVVLPYLVGLLTSGILKFEHLLLASYVYFALSFGLVGRTQPRPC